MSSCGLSGKFYAKSECATKKINKKKIKHFNVIKQGIPEKIIKQKR